VRWLRDYGAFVAAAVAALVAFINLTVGARQRQAEWLRATRLTAYVALQKASNDFGHAIDWHFGNGDPDIMGPKPKELPDYDTAHNKFLHSFAEVNLLGPATVVAATHRLRSALWYHQSGLEGSQGFDAHWDLIREEMDAFTKTAQRAVRAHRWRERVVRPMTYGEWRAEAQERRRQEEERQRELRKQAPPLL
jgi:hypothetical protein